MSDPLVEVCDSMPEFVPSVDIIVPVYNGERTIGACLESLLKQAFPLQPAQILVVENGSTDHTSQVVEAYPVELLHSLERGPAAARNLGIRSSQAEIIAFTDADCVADPGWLAALVKPFINPDVAGVGGNILPYQHSSPTFAEIFSAEHAPLVNFMSGAAEFLPHLYTANAAYLRSAVGRVGGFNARLYTGEDVDLSWRVQLESKARMVYAPEAIVYHHHRASYMSLARQFRQYGFGEILLDMLYQDHDGYPRTRRYQLRRIFKQLAALPRYILSALIRSIRLLLGRTTPYNAAVPRIWLTVEAANLLGKFEALFASRWMTKPETILDIDADRLIRRFYH